MTPPGGPAGAERARGARPALIIGGYGVGNVGDEAILAGLLQEHADLRDAMVVSYDPAQTERLHGVAAVSPLSPRFLRALRRAGTVVVGGGGLFSAYTGPLARGIPWAALLARRMGRRVEFRAVGAYPGTPAVTARVLARAVERAHHVSVRDASSERYLRALGVRRPIERVQDPALALAPPPRAHVRTLLAARAPRALGRFVLFGVRRIKDREAGPRLERALAGLGTVLLDHGVEPVLLPFSAHPYEYYADDRRLARELAQAIGGGTVLDAELHPRVVLGVVRESACVVAMRLHAMLFALRAARPLVAIPYDAKCTDVLEEHGLEGVDPAHATGLALADRVGEALRAPAEPREAPGEEQRRSWPPAGPDPAARPAPPGGPA